MLMQNQITNQFNTHELTSKHKHQHNGVSELTSSELSNERGNISSSGVYTHYQLCSNSKIPPNNNYELE